ncbi:hypothetical protein CUMW_128280 [Citrus unshiu]|uniref:Uncharacterized protein n=1 Tax=Citrus unshiu TaxID=55188 RepID=A0A2H5PEV3_CITUN|nr:hypothetical protein CUMW_128280 [Citrus unshiu]
MIFFSPISSVAAPELLFVWSRDDIDSIAPVQHFNKPFNHREINRNLLEGVIRKPLTHCKLAKNSSSNELLIRRI